MNIRLANTNDIAAIMQVMDAARAIMRASGNMHQWEDGYPSELVVMTDIERQGGYVIEEDDKVFPMVPAGASISEAFDASDLPLD